jgi:hypothetical protein
MRLAAYDQVAVKATTELANVSGTELTDGGCGRRLQVPQGSTSSPVLEEGGVFLLAPRHRLVAVAGAPRACQYRAPSRRGMEVVKVWPSEDLAVTLPGRVLGATVIV